MNNVRNKERVAGNYSAFSLNCNIESTNKIVAHNFYSQFPIQTLQIPVIHAVRRRHHISFADQCTAARGRLVSVCCFCQMNMKNQTSSHPAFAIEKNERFVFTHVSSTQSTPSTETHPDASPHRQISDCSYRCRIRPVPATNYRRRLASAAVHPCSKRPAVHSHSHIDCRAGISDRLRRGAHDG